MSIATGRILLKLKKVQGSNGTHIYSYEDNKRDIEPSPVPFRSYGDLVVFTPVDTEENIKLIKRIDNCLEKNGLSKLNVKD